MKTVMDLLEEYCVLNEARIELRGKLDLAWETRWRDLNRFYERLMVARPLPKRGAFEVEEIQRRLKRRARLRVRAEMNVFFRHDDTYHRSRALDLSHGGLFLCTGFMLPVGTHMTLYLPNLGWRYEMLFETTVEVAWTTPGVASRLPRGMGVRFLGLESSALEQLDTFIVESLRDRLSRASVEALAPDLAGRVSLSA